jgi:hypothetical protein
MELNDEKEAIIAGSCKLLLESCLIDNLPLALIVQKYFETLWRDCSKE